MAPRYYIRLLSTLRTIRSWRRRRLCPYGRRPSAGLPPPILIMPRMPGWHWDADSGGEGLQHLALTAEAQRQALRAELRATNGDADLEIVDATRPDFAERAASLFERDGFVAVGPAMTPAQLDLLSARAREVAADIVALDRHGGQKGVGRFMFGGSCSSTRSQSHERAFAMMAELPVVDAVLTAIWGSPDFFCTGSGGDIAMPGSEYQPLHSDSSTAPHKPVLDGAGRIVDYVLEDGAVAWQGRDGPARSVVVDFAAVPLTWENGPIRFAKGTQNSRSAIPTLAAEPMAMKTATVCPAPAGTAVFRDPRTHHGGTPNLSSAPRPIPGIAMSLAWPGHRPDLTVARTMPRAIYEDLSPRGQQICSYLVEEDDGEALDQLRRQWKAPQVGFVDDDPEKHRLSPAQLQEMRSRVGGSQTGLWPVPSAKLQENPRFSAAPLPSAWAMVVVTELPGCSGMAVDLAGSTGDSLSEEVLHRLRGLLEARGVLLLRGHRCDGDVGSFSRLCAALGSLHDDVNGPGRGRAELASAGCDTAVHYISNLDLATHTALPGPTSMLSEGNHDWHADYSWAPEPRPRFTALFGMKVSAGGGAKTQLASTRKGFETLPARLLEQCTDGNGGGRWVRHQPGGSQNSTGRPYATAVNFAGTDQTAAGLAAATAQAADDGFDVESAAAAAEPVRRPLVLRGALLLGKHACAVEGEVHDGDGGLRLLEQLTAHCLDESRVYTHSWLENDILIWDNEATLHRAVEGQSGEPRHLARTVIAQLHHDASSGQNSRPCL